MIGAACVGWYTLPQEIRDTILSLVLAEWTVDFRPRRRSQGARQVKRQCWTNRSPSTPSLFLVSKRFFSAEELYQGLLRYTKTVRTHDGLSSWQSLATRFGSPSVLTIRALHVTMDIPFRFPTSLASLAGRKPPPAFPTSLHPKERMTICFQSCNLGQVEYAQLEGFPDRLFRIDARVNSNYPVRRDPRRRFIGRHEAHVNLLGRCLPPPYPDLVHMDRVEARHLQYIMEDFLLDLSPEYHRWVADFLDGRLVQSAERVIHLGLTIYMPDVTTTVPMVSQFLSSG